jgi:hypothetical protein
MSLETENQELTSTVVATSRWVWSALGVAVGTGTLISLVKSGLSIELIGIPAKVYQSYAWVRDIVFLPIVWFGLYFAKLPTFETWGALGPGLKVPPWLKDFFMAYGLVVGAHWRSLRSDPRHAKSVMRGTIRCALFWPVYQAVVYSSQSEWRRIAELPDRATIYDEYDGGRWLMRRDRRRYLLQGALKARRLIFWNLVAIVLCTCVFFLWNSISNAFGPK